MSVCQLRRRSQMRSYQKWASDLLIDNKRVLLQLPIGGGKTIIAADAVSYLIEARRAKRVLIIGSLNIIENVWPDEFKRWLHLWDLRHEVLTGSEKGRLFALQRRADIYLINRENLPWLWRKMRALDLPLFDTLIVDECTILKHAKKRTPPRSKDGVRVGGGALSRFGAVVNFAKHADRVIELTGTVGAPGLRGMWGMVYPLDWGERLGATKTDFEGRWFYEDGYYGYGKKPRDGAMKDITSRVSDLVIAPDLSEHIKKHPVEFNPIWVHLREDEMRRYKKFERTLYEEVTDIEAISRGVLTNKLCQLANGSLYDENGDDVPVHDHKLHALEDLVDELDGEPLLVAYSFKFDLKRMRKRFPKLRVLNEDRDAYADWNKGRIPLLAAHPASCGHGLNLQYGGSNQCWYGFQWDGELWMQMNGRLPRSGQKAPQVKIHLLLAHKTEDERMYDKMCVGEATQDEITNLVLRPINGNRRYG